MGPPPPGGGAPLLSSSGGGGGNPPAGGSTGGSGAPYNRAEIPLDKLAAAVKNADKVTARNILGESLYPKVISILGSAPGGPAQPGKITGMLLELETQEIIALLDDKASLEKKISEARDVLRNAAAQGGPLPPVRQ